MATPKLTLVPSVHSRTCTKCGETKPLAAFSSHPTGRYGLTSRCRPCIRDYDALPTRLAAKRVRDRARRKTAVGRADALLRDGKRRAAKKGIPFSLNCADIAATIAAGVCQATGLPFDLTTKGRNPSTPSLDRIDPTKGYTPDNVQVVIWQFNAAKQEFSLPDLLVLATALVTKYGLVQTTQKPNPKARPKLVAASK